MLGVALLPHWLPPGWAEPNAVAVVIDTLRFTSTACQALAAGARSISVLSDIQAARDLAATTQPRQLLCGERLCAKIPGFDLGNSPAEYTRAVVNDRDLIFSTTNGTVAVEACAAARAIALGSLLNRASIVQWLHNGWNVQPATSLTQKPSKIWIVCAGTDGQVAAEDVLTAGAILDGLLQLAQPDQSLNDAAQLALDAWRNVDREGSLLHRLQQARGGSNLIESGFARDIDLVAQLDSCDCVPVSQQGSAFRLFGELRP